MVLHILYVLAGLISTVVFLLVVGFFILRRWLLTRKVKMHTSVEAVVNVGIFHPFCNDGGGGERVLWCVVRALQAKYDNIRVFIYTGDKSCSPETLIRNARNHFNVEVDKENTSFIYLKHRRLVESRMYPYFTILGQSLASVILGFEALYRCPPDVFIETTGYSFVLPLFRFLGSCSVGCYIHYPTISTDMIDSIKTRTPAAKNQGRVIRNPFFTWLKLAYYQIFAKLYCWVGRSSQTIMVNSSWTENHILDLWKAPFKTHRVYPPCGISHLKALRRSENKDIITILSVGQFRPEKNHPMQLQAMYYLRTLLANNEELWNKIRFIVVGSCRNSEDYERLKNMQDLSRHLSLEKTVEFKVNVSYQELLEYYQSAQIGVHTMWNEHFGIGIVECMAAGLIMVAHRSGGPLLDIIETSEGCQTGFLAVDANDYANCILNIIYNSKEENDRIRNAARASVERFSEKEFEISFLRAISPIINQSS